MTSVLPAARASQPVATAQATAGACRSRLAAAGLCVLLAVPLAVFGWIGSYARYVADDYCWAGVLRTQGFFKAQVDWYTDYSPRYAFTFIVNLVELAGPAIVPVLPITAIVAWLAALTWLFRQLRLGLSWLAALALAGVVAVATFESAPDLPQSLYWQTGMLTYLLPLILATLLAGWLARAAQRGTAGPAWAVLASGLLTFVAGGLSEAYLIPQNVGLTLVLGACLVFWRGPRSRAIRPHLVAALLGGVLALAVIVVAPATAYRVGGPPADLRLALAAAIATCWYQGLRLVRFFWPVVLLCLAAPSALALTTGWRPRQVDRRDAALLGAIVAVTLPFCYFPSFYAQNGNPPARSLIVPAVLFVGYAVYLGFAATPWLRRQSPRLAPALAVAVVALVPVGVARVSWPAAADAAQHAAWWDAEDQQIRAARAAGVADVVVPPLPPYLGENFVTPDRKNWFNVCVARYYDVASIAATQ